MYEGTLAEIRLFAGTFAPRGWEICNGQVMQIRQASALFSLLGTQFGGDGISTFALPSLTPLSSTGEVSEPINYVICVEGVYPARHDNG